MEDGDSIDDLSVYYNGNQIDYIVEPESEMEARTHYDFKDYSDIEKAKYEYDANGAMIKDPYKGMSVQ